MDGSAEPVVGYEAGERGIGLNGWEEMRVGKMPAKRLKRGKRPVRCGHGGVARDGSVIPQTDCKVSYLYSKI